VTHQGYDAKLLRKGEKVSLFVEITPVRRSTRTCLLSAPATTRSDEIRLNLRSV